MMRLVYFAMLVLIIENCYCKEADTNEIKSGTLDTSLRRALLKALTELENEEKQYFLTNSNNISIIPILFSNKSVEKVPASAINVYESNSDKSSTEQQSEKPTVFIQKSTGLQHKPITLFIPPHGESFNETEHFVASASNSFSQPGRKELNKLDQTSKNSITSLKLPNSKLKVVTTKTDFTSPSPTVASPTTEESEAKVEDVQFFSAPLVAAFTVHQDERGLPKSVEPIYKQSVQIPVTSNIIDRENFNQQQELYRQELLKQEELRNQIALQEKQRALEEQVQKLQHQQKQQQEYLLKQQKLLQEQQVKLQNQKLLEERARIQNNERPFVPIITPSQTQQNNQQFRSYHNSEFSHINDQYDNQQLNSHTNSNFNVKSNDQFNAQIPNFNKGDKGASIVSFQSSVSLNPVDQINKANELPYNAQLLPTKNSVDFHNSPYIHTSTLNQIHSVLTAPQVPAISHFNYAHSIDVPVIVQNNRIFRREPTGNFDHAGNRILYNTVSLQQMPQVSNVRLLRSNLESYHTSPGFLIQPPVVNQHLNNLLYQSGIVKGRQNEDLNIVSKVLSYNHVGGDNFFSGSKISDQRLYYPLKRSDKNM